MRSDVEIILLRHGETVWNREGRFQGVRDSPLTMRGIRQVHAFGHALRAHLGRERREFRLVSSPLGRAWQTAVLLAEMLDVDPLAVVRDDLVREISWGRWDGLTAVEIDRDDPEIWRRRLDDAFAEAPPHGGESRADVLARAREWLQRLEPGARIILVAHGTFNRALRCAYLDLPSSAMLELDAPQDAFFHLARGRIARIAAASAPRPSSAHWRSGVAALTCTGGQGRGEEAMPQRPVREILSREVLVSGPPEMTVAEAARRMAEHCCGSILVFEGGRLAGIFTERDLTQRVVAAGLDPRTTPLGRVMTRDPDVVAADAPVAEAIRLMDECRYKHLPVVEGDRVIGVLAPEDVPVSELLALGEELEERHALAERMW